MPGDPPGIAETGPRRRADRIAVAHSMLVMSTSHVEGVLDWYAHHARDLPWRIRGASPWSVLVSEVMLQQTPVARVLPAHRAWLQRWPTPPALAAEPPGEAIRQWGRLGYPRRAVRLHETAEILTRRYAGEVPACHQELLALPGIGTYTAAAVASFAFGQRHAVVDTNVRRVVTRAVTGAQSPRRGPSAAERALVESLLPDQPHVAARWSAAVMELGALVCTADRPECAACPLVRNCRWLADGRPDGPRRRGGQRYEGTDRQCRGRLLAVLRDARGPVSAVALDTAWDEPVQRARALHGLVTDRLAVALTDGRYALPGETDR